MAAPISPTPLKILDAAEELFAHHGYAEVTTRAITERAGVRLNLLTYHFGSKEGLFKAVIDRRLDVIIEHREQALRRLRESGEQVSVGKILRAFIEPYYELSQGDRGWLDHARLVALTAQSEQGFQVLDRYMQRTVRVFIQALQDALPGVPRRTVRVAFYHAITLMMGSFSGANRIDELWDANASGEDLRKALSPLITFAEGGILALAAGPKKRADPGGL